MERCGKSVCLARVRKKERKEERERKRKERRKGVKKEGSEEGRKGGGYFTLVWWHTQYQEPEIKGSL